MSLLQVLIHIASVLASVVVVYDLVTRQWGLQPTMYWLDALLLKLLARKSLFLQMYLLGVGLYGALVSMHWGLSQNPTILEAYLPFGVFVLFEAALLVVLMTLTVGLIPAGIYTLFVKHKVRS